MYGADIDAVDLTYEIAHLPLRLWHHLPPDDPLSSSVVRSLRRPRRVTL